MDGTLSDSGEGIMNSTTYALNRLSLPVPERTELRKMVGPPLSVGFSSIGVPEEFVDEAVRLYREDYHTVGKYQNIAYPGIENLLAKLKADGYRLFVATSKPEKLSYDILVMLKLDDYFEIIAGATLDSSRENKTDVLKYLLEKIGANDNAILIGDTEYDVIGARDVGIPCIGVSWGYGDVSAMKDNGSVLIADSPDEIYEYIVRTNEREP
jgi:haloacid dehalogenase superfamily, subfamily IA, variant 1 with third motif having Dx(3-4)D or Dx(3-4)E